MEYVDLLKVYYEMIARIIKDPHIDLSDYHDGCMGNTKLIDKNLLITSFANQFKTLDSKFDWKKFLDMCGY